MNRCIWTVALVCAAAMSLHAKADESLLVSNVEELYAAVNDPANAGATLVLAPGIYMLSVTAPDGVPRPKRGRIELQPDMALKGVEGDRSAVVISAFNLPASSFPLTANGVATGPNAAVRTGLGHNAVEWLTVRDARFAQANIDTGLQPLDPETAVVRIAHVASTGSTRGLTVLNFGLQTSGQAIDAEIIDSYFFDNVYGVSQGVRIVNFETASGSTINVRMSGNLSWGQKQGRSLENNRAVDSTVNVVSFGNRFYDNGGGTIIVGGLSSNNSRADGNAINVEAHGDQFVSNTAASELTRGGVVVFGGLSDVTGGASNNTVHVTLWGCRMLDNTDADLIAIGARWVADSTAGLSENNQVTIEIHGDGGGNGRWQPVEFVADTVPAGPTYGNAAAVIRY